MGARLSVTRDFSRKRSTRLPAKALGAASSSAVKPHARSVRSRVTTPPSQCRATNRPAPYYGSQFGYKPAVRPGSKRVESEERFTRRVCAVPVADASQWPSWARTSSPERRPYGLATQQLNTLRFADQDSPSEGGRFGDGRRP